jgi:transcription elongation factor Elf1
MSKRVEAKISCPNCNHQFDFTLYRSIWGEYPENRELVMTDKINVASCPSCNVSTKVVYPFIYTNTNQQFAVWWEPLYDAQIDSDKVGYAKMVGEGNYLATAPRIKDWNEFKNTILKFERGELKAKTGTISKDMEDKMQGFLKHIEDKNKKSKSGCLGIALVLVVFGSCLFYGISKIHL